MKKLIIVFMLGIFVNCAYSESITVDISGTIYDVNDPFGVLGIVEGTFTGSYTYESAQAPLTHIPDQSTYVYNTPPNGMVIQIGDLVFSTDSSGTDFLIQIADNRLSRDIYIALSYNNTFSDNDGIYVESISMQLNDIGMAALDDHTLTTEAPDLAQWPTRQLYIMGSDDKFHPTLHFSISGTVEYAEASGNIPEPLSLVLLCLSGLILWIKKII